MVQEVKDREHLKKLEERIGHELVEKLIGGHRSPLWGFKVVEWVEAAREALLDQGYDRKVLWIFLKGCAGPGFPGYNPSVSSWPMEQVAETLGLPSLSRYVREAEPNIVLPGYQVPMFCEAALLVLRDGHYKI